jgi:hypothetical protein
MPKEVRYLMFSNEELYQALLANLRGRAQPMPKGFLKSIAVKSDEKQTVTLVFASQKGPQDVIIFEEQEVLRTLIGYCSQRHIPLSAKATKTIEVKDGTIGLMCTLNFNSDKITASGDKLSYQDAQTDSFKNAAKAAATTATKAPAPAPKTSEPPASRS